MNNVRSGGGTGAASYSRQMLSRSSRWSLRWAESWARARDWCEIAFFAACARAVECGSGARMGPALDSAAATTWIFLRRRSGVSQGNFGAAAGDRRDERRLEGAPQLL